jgi:hypothetical protein
MYQEAIEQNAKQIGIFGLAKFSLSCPGTQIHDLQPNPQMESVDALLAESYNSVPLFPLFEVEDNERIDALTFFDAKTLEAAFEHEFSSDPSNRFILIRGHAGRIYGGCYGDTKKEAKYQAFIRDTPRVMAAVEALQAVNLNQDRLECFDALQEDYTPENNDALSEYWEESYPYDLQDDDIISDPRASPSYTAVSDDLFDEPFIRAPLVSEEAEEFMEREFYEHYWEKQGDEAEEREKDYDAESYGDCEHYDNDW